MQSQEKTKTNKQKSCIGNRKETITDTVQWNSVKTFHGFFFSTFDLDLSTRRKRTP